jgi:hypothetical protein
MKCFPLFSQLGVKADGQSPPNTDCVALFPY